MRLTTGDRELAAAVAKANPLEHKRAGQISRTGAVRMLGADSRLASNDEDLTEDQLLEIDRGYAAGKAADPFRQAEADRAQIAELHQMRCQGLL